MNYYDYEYLAALGIQNYVFGYIGLFLLGMIGIIVLLVLFVLLLEVMH